MAKKTATAGRVGAAGGGDTGGSAPGFDVEGLAAEIFIRRLTHRTGYKARELAIESFTAAVTFADVAAEIRHTLAAWPDAVEPAGAVKE